MSYLALPRLGFRGTTAAVNPPTANNNAVAIAVDHREVTLNVPETIDPTDEAQCRAWLTSLVSMRVVDAPGAAGPTRIEMPAYANYYGDHATSFGDAAINSVWLQDGMLLTADGGAADALLGARVAIDARIVDLDPSDAFSTQIIAGTLRVVGCDDAGQPCDLIVGREPTVACSRWLNVARPMGAAIFQCAVPRERLTFARRGYSPALDALEDAAARSAGLLLRYCLYAMKPDPALTREVMHRRFRQGQRVASPRIGRVLGSIGVWQAEDMPSAPVGRLLYPPASRYCLNVPCARPAPASRPVYTHDDVSRLWIGAGHTAGQQGAPQDTVAADGVPLAAAHTGGPQGMVPTGGPPGMVNAGGPPTVPYTPGPAVAVVDHARQVVMLDVLSTFPEVGKAVCPKESTLDLSKVDIGPVSLAVLYAGPDGRRRAALIGPVPYDRTTYEDQAGVVEVSYAAQPELVARIDGGTLVLVHEPDSHVPDAVLLQEIDTVAIETDDRCVYVQQDRPAAIVVRAFSRGQPTQEPITLTLEQWRDRPYIDRDGASADTPAGQGRPTVSQPRMGFEPVEPGDPAWFIPPSITVPPGGLAHVTITPRGPRSPGCYKVCFVPPGARPDTDFQPELEFFANVRILPADDYSGVPDGDVTWQFVYREVFSYYVLVYPAICGVLPLEPVAPPDPGAAQALAARIEQCLGERDVASPQYLPMLLELSEGKRRLVQRWCALQKGER